MTPQLTPHAVPAILNNNTDLKPVLQCIGVKAMQAQQQGAAERYRLALSDGQNWCTAMLASQLNELVTGGALGSGKFLRLNDYLCQIMQSKRIIIILALDILGYGEKVGDPQQYADPGVNAAAPNAQPLHHQQLNGAGHAGPPMGNAYTNGSVPQQPAMQAYGGGTVYGGPPRGGYAGQQNAGLSNSDAAFSGGYSSSAYGQRPQPCGAQPGSGSGAPQQGGYGYGAGGGVYGQAQIAGGYGQAPAYRANNAPVARNEAAPKIVPIASLNAYQNRWTIKARISQRSEMRRWSNAKGEGKFFTVDLLDAQGGEIRAISFNEVADKFDSVLQMGNVVTISKASLRPKKPGSVYNQTRHDHEITLEKQTVIEVCPEDHETNSIPQIQYHFRRIEEIESTPANTVLDVIGVVEFVDQATRITRKDGAETEKRSLTLRDESNKSIELTFWGQYAANPGEQLEAMVREGQRPILAAKSIRVGDFSGKTLSTVGASLLSVDPDHPAVASLRNWFDNQGAQMQATKLSNQRGSSSGRVDRRCTLSAIKDEGLGTDGQPAYVQVLCYITMLKQDSMYYPACTLQYNGRSCNKKLTDQGSDGRTWWCERCGQETQPDWRYILSVQADDHTGQQWLTAFQESGLEIIGMSATELRDLEKSDMAAFEVKMLQTLHKSFLLKIKVAEETYNDETRIKTNIIRADPVDFVKESRVLIDFIGKIKRGEPVMAPQPAASPMAAGGGYQAYGGNVACGAAPTGANFAPNHNAGAGGGYSASYCGNAGGRHGGFGQGVGGHSSGSTMGGGGFGPGGF